jgi:hypothetical protein
VKENSICGDNRFEIIEKAKEMLLNATNIEDSKEEMKVLTNILFRMWQVGLINEEKLDINKLQKENSIEEDIKIANNFMAYFNKNIQNGYKADLTVLGEEIEAIEHILSDYKRVLKENEELKKSKITYERVRNIQIENKKIVNKKYISKQKIKEVIKELEENIYRIKKQYSNGGENCNTVYLENLAQVKILKQMLRESEE